MKLKNYYYKMSQGSYDEMDDKIIKKSQKKSQKKYPIVMMIMILVDY